ncbi:hypothetical protein DPMN_062849 [Dreissena polymorpha]|uniref:Uncharacterized protein n=1 Tax=Dreissena polymorpha TaxID=45954 RepID=A0A9D4CA97_DREPO|nr:hypothetical protein DPMN_062849 [Dreissena polymorpha]
MDAMNVNCRDRLRFMRQREMKFEAVKSRYLIIQKSHPTDRFTLQVQNEEKPSIIQRPIKCLGKLFDVSL